MWSYKKNGEKLETKETVKIVEEKLLEVEKEVRVEKK